MGILRAAFLFWLKRTRVKLALSWRRRQVLALADGGTLLLRSWSYQELIENAELLRSPASSTRHAAAVVEIALPPRHRARVAALSSEDLQRAYVATMLLNDRPRIFALVREAAEAGEEFKRLQEES